MKSLSKLMTFLGETVVPEGNRRLEKNLKGSSTNMLRRILADSSQVNPR
jgi:hypothetical protein